MRLIIFCVFLATLEQGTCLPRENCNLANCDAVENLLQQVLPGGIVK